MQEQFTRNGYDFSFGNSVQTLEQYTNKRSYTQHKQAIRKLNKISETPKFAQVKEGFKSTKKTKSKPKNNKASMESLFGSRQIRSKSNLNFMVSLSANKSNIDKIQINCNSYVNKTPVVHYQRPKSLTPRILSRCKSDLSQQRSPLTPKVLFSEYQSKPELHNTFRRLQNEKQPFRKTFNRKQYIDKRLNNTKIHSNSGLLYQKSQPRQSSKKRFIREPFI